jgi:hypothetical protein
VITKSWQYNHYMSKGHCQEAGESNLKFGSQTMLVLRSYGQQTYNNADFIAHESIKWFKHLRKALT